MASRAPKNVPRELTCPSGRCEEGAILLGIVGGEGVLGYIRPRIEVDAAFCREAHKETRPETRFRFAQQCVEGRCVQWTGSRCGLIHRVLESPKGAKIAETSSTFLPECVIRPSCRWFAQVGVKACSVCPWIVHSLEGTADMAEPVA